MLLHSIDNCIWRNKEAASDCISLMKWKEDEFMNWSGEGKCLGFSPITMDYDVRMEVWWAVLQNVYILLKYRTLRHSLRLWILDDLVAELRQKKNIMLQIVGFRLGFLKKDKGNRKQEMISKGRFFCMFWVPFCVQLQD